MDKEGLVRWRLFRESCCPYEGNYVKDLNCLGRDLSTTIIVDNSPHSYIFQPANAVPIGTFIDDMEDQELLELLPQLLQVCVCLFWVGRAHSCKDRWQLGGMHDR
eukprot:GHUV01056727.1.p2 GENE.GHUV01056727.1~~GHUV01056727.1.p2  ORF type:complete len:105 (-),score=26.97 GHUV01056727.1:18-332(-)